MTPVDARHAGPSVLVACDFFAKYTAGLVRGLADCGADVQFLYRDHDFEFGGIGGSLDAYIDSVVGDRVIRHQLRGRPRQPRTWRQALAIRRAAARRPTDVVHLQDSVMNDPRLLLASGARPGRFALTVHDVLPHPGEQRNPFWHRATNHALRRFAGLLFVHAEPLRETLISLGASPDRVVVVPHGVDPPDPRPLLPVPRLLFFGRMVHYKGLDILLDAMAVVWASRPEVEVEVAGEGPLPDHPALEDPRVTVRNAHVPDADLAEAFGRARLVVLPYREASQSGVGSMAKRFGRPMVVTDVGGLPELVADGSGLLVPPEDPARLAASILDLLADPARVERMAAAGLETATSAGGWTAVAERTLAAYERCLGVPAPVQPTVTPAAPRAAASG